MLCVGVFVVGFFSPPKEMLQLLEKEYNKAEQKFSIIILLCASLMVDSLRRVTELEQLCRNALRVGKNIDGIFWFRKKMTEGEN